MRTSASDCRTIASNSLASVGSMNIRKLSKQARSLSGGMWQTGHSAGRSGSEAAYARNWPSRWMLSGQVFGRGRCNGIPPEH